MKSCTCLECLWPSDRIPVSDFLRTARTVEEVFASLRAEPAWTGAQTFGIALARLGHYINIRNAAHGASL